mgnify:CR=1 FL=1
MNISEFCKIYTGNGFPMEFQGKKDGKYPFYKVSDISASNAQQKIFLGSANNYIDEFDVSMLKGNIIPAGTIVFAKIGEALKLNKRAITSCECLIDNNVIGIKPDDNIINLLYFYYYLLKIDMIHYSESTTLPSVRKSTIEKIEVKIPPIDVQNKRVSILNLCHETIKYKVELLYNLELLVKSRFVELFGDPVLNEKGWNLISLESVCQSIYGGGTPSKKIKEYYMGTIPWVTSKDMKSDIIVDSIEHITQVAIDNSSTKIIPPESVLIVIRSGILKHTLPVCINKSRVTINQDLKALVLDERCKAIYLQYLLKALEKDILSGVRAVTADNIEFNSLKKRKIPIPPINIQIKFSQMVNQINKLKSDVQKSIDETQLLMDSLMQEYFG